MKIFSAMLCLAVLIFGVGISVSAGQGNPGTVTIGFVLHKIPAIASNQLAVWVEDDRGGYVKTLYATRFTAEGGFRKRPQSLPEWVEVSNWAKASRIEVDAVSGATRKAGSVELVWDCTDRNGKPVAAGTYVYKIEGNISWNDRVVWQGSVKVGGARNSSAAQPAYFPETAAGKGALVEQVKAVFEPLP